MAGKNSKHTLVSTVALVIAIAGIPGGNMQAGASDMMQQCAKPIDVHCTGVRKGRGRITACLFSHWEKLPASCALEVDRIADGSILAKASAEGLRKGEGKDLFPKLRLACRAEISRLCSNVASGEGRKLACLYSRSNKASSTCISTMKTVLEQL